MGERLSVPERLVVAPTVGVFHRLAGHDRIKDGDLVNLGDVIGSVQSLRVTTLVQSPFAGLLVQFLTCEGERVRPGQPVAWVRVR
jgi:biotin carboxyl carrier protein